MRPQGPTFWLLDGITGWRTGHGADVAVAGEAGIRLAARPDGPLALTGADGSLGGLVLPRGMALDGADLAYLLDREALRIKRYAPEQRSFFALPGIGGLGADARQLSAETASIAISGNDLYVADAGNHRVQVFALSSLALRQVWGPLDASGRPAGEDDTPWDPVDVAAVPDLAVVLDTCHGAVYAIRPGVDALRRVIAEPAASARWRRVAIDPAHRVYLLDPQLPRLEVYGLDGLKLEDVTDAGEVLDRFPPPPVRLDHRGRFCLPASLSPACGRTVPAAVPRREDPLDLCRAGGLLFDRRGAPLEAITDPEPAGPGLYRDRGVWISEALDSRLYDCQWHRLELALQALPTGARVRLSTYADNEARTLEDVRALPDHLWQGSHELVGSNQPRSLPQSRQADALVLSGAGRHLWIRLELGGDGYDTPVVEALRAHYPRRSYLEHLPATYAADDEARDFLARFLSLFQTVWDGLEHRIEQFARYLDPEAVPDGPWVDYLAAWLALPLEGGWSNEQKRRLLAAAPGFYPRRGTPDALRGYLQAYLANITGIDAASQRGLPVVIEGFRHRNYLMLAGTGALDSRHSLWGPGILGRLQLDVHATAGRVRLLSTGDPERDLFHAHAHRFQVFVPSAWVRRTEDERRLRRALDAEKPAHAAYTLCLVEPRLRVGVQSTVGVDTVVGDIPAARLACPDEDSPPSRPPRHHLGYDTVLGGHPGPEGGVPLNPGTRVGMDTVMS